jgi:hypothetical protein
VLSEECEVEWEVKKVECEVKKKMEGTAKGET